MREYKLLKKHVKWEYDGDRDTPPHSGAQCIPGKLSRLKQSDKSSGLENCTRDAAFFMEKMS